MRAHLLWVRMVRIFGTRLDIYKLQYYCISIYSFFPKVRMCVGALTATRTKKSIYVHNTRSRSENIPSKMDQVSTEGNLMHLLAYTTTALL